MLESWLHFINLFCTSKDHSPSCISLHSHTFWADICTVRCKWYKKILPRQQAVCLHSLGPCLEAQRQNQIQTCPLSRSLRFLSEIWLRIPFLSFRFPLIHRAWLRSDSGRFSVSCTQVCWTWTCTAQAGHIRLASGYPQQLQSSVLQALALEELIYKCWAHPRHYNQVLQMCLHCSLLLLSFLDFFLALISQELESLERAWSKWSHSYCSWSWFVQTQKISSPKAQSCPESSVPLLWSTMIHEGGMWSAVYSTEWSAQQTVV